MKLVAEVLDCGCNFREKAIESISVNAIRTLPPDDWISPVIGVIGRPVSISMLI
jgi:hypothetical protein